MSILAYEHRRHGYYQFFTFFLELGKVNASTFNHYANRNAVIAIDGGWLLGNSKKKKKN